MKRILIFGVTENPGGVETFILNYFRMFNKDNIRCDFLCNSKKPMAFEKECISMGARVFHITSRRDNPPVYWRELKALFEQHATEWNAIWVNVNSLANIDYLKLAKKYGIPKRIIHSHNSDNMDSRLRGALHHWNRRKIDNYATDFWACSQKAARWFYRSEILPKSVVIHNAIRIEGLAFDPAEREHMRRIMDCVDCMVIGNTGRLRFEKNQTLALDILKAIHVKGIRAKLVLVGSGEDEQKLREKSAAIGVEDDVVFAGFQSDIGPWLNAFDVFLFPSLFEGLGIAALEAQANGLPVVAAREGVPEEVQVNENVCFVSLKDDPEIWAERVIDLANGDRADPYETCQRFKEKGYEISGEISRLEGYLMQ